MHVGYLTIPNCLPRHMMIKGLQLLLHCYIGDRLGISTGYRFPLDTLEKTAGVHWESIKIFRGARVVIQLTPCNLLMCETALHSLRRLLESRSRNLKSNGSRHHSDF